MWGGGGTGRGDTGDTAWPGGPQILGGGAAWMWGGDGTDVRDAAWP